MFRNNNFACGLCLSIVALTATMCLCNVNRGGRINRKKKAKKHQYPTFPDQYLPTPLERSEVWCNKIFTLVPTLNPSLCFVTEQSSGNSEKEKQRQKLDSGAFRPRVITTHSRHYMWRFNEGLSAVRRNTE